jgi:hypothetical protein
LWVFRFGQFGALLEVGFGVEGGFGGGACGGAMGDLVYNIVPVDGISAASTHPTVQFPEVCRFFELGAWGFGTETIPPGCSGL